MSYINKVKIGSEEYSIRSENDHIHSNKEILDTITEINDDKTYGFKNGKMQEIDAKDYNYELYKTDHESENHNFFNGITATKGQGYNSDGSVFYKDNISQTQFVQLNGAKK